MSARIIAKGLTCTGCQLHLLVHLYKNLMKVRDADGRNYLSGRCPGCTTPFRREMFSVDVVTRGLPRQLTPQETSSGTNLFAPTFAPSPFTVRPR